MKAYMCGIPGMGGFLGYRKIKDGFDPEKAKVAFCLDCNEPVENAKYCTITPAGSVEKFEKEYYPLKELVVEE